MEDNKIVLSEKELGDIIDSGRAISWARNMIASRDDRNFELSDEDVAISEAVNSMIKDVWKHNSSNAKTKIAELVGWIVEPEIFKEPNEILEKILPTKYNFSEFDKVRLKPSPKNTLVARTTALRTGNVRKSFIDYYYGTSTEESLQIETELKMDDLRRDGAMGIAQLSVFAIEEFERAKFRIILDFVDGLVVGGDNYFTCAGGNITGTAFEDFTGNVYDNATGSDIGEVIGLSNIIRKGCKAVNADFLSSNMKEELNKLSKLQEYNGALLVPVKKGERNGKGETLLPSTKLFGFSGVVGSQYTKGELRTLVIEDGNPETINLKFTGVEFGIHINNVNKLSKLEIQ